MNLLLPLVMLCAPGFSNLCWLEAKTRIKFTFNEVLIQRMPRRFKSPCAAQTELGQKLLVATASATGDDEVPPHFFVASLV